MYVDIVFHDTGNGQTVNCILYASCEEEVLHYNTYKQVLKLSHSSVMFYFSFISPIFQGAIYVVPSSVYIFWNNPIFLAHVIDILK